MGNLMKNGISYSGGDSLPKGGTTGQVLTKKSNTDKDVEWADATGGGNASYSIDKTNNTAIVQSSEGQSLSFDFSEDDSLGVIAADPGTYYKEGKVGKFREYVLSLEDVGGNVVPIGAITVDNVRYGLYEFFYKTGALPASNSTKVYSFASLLANYSILNFIDATGITSNGIFIGNGRTDNDNRVIVQQFSKNNKTITLRAYQDFTRETGTLKVQFIGKKNV